MIASMFGLETRSTMDMDGTIKGIKISAQHIEKIFNEICEIDLKDNITFLIKNIEQIREKDNYEGFRISIEASHPPMLIPLKIDITTGDKITPKEIVYEFKLLFEPRHIRILAYNIETLLSEKLETIISRGDQSTRPRDYYDIYVIYQLMSKNIDWSILAKAFEETVSKRGTTKLIGKYSEILASVENSSIMKKHWSNYQVHFHYAEGIKFEDICMTIRKIMDRMDRVSEYY